MVLCCLPPQVTQTVRQPPRKRSHINTIRARYEVGIEKDTSLEHFRLWSDASTRAIAINGYVFDRMARIGKPTALASQSMVISLFDR